MIIYILFKKLFLEEQNLKFLDYQLLVNMLILVLYL